MARVRLTKGDRRTIVDAICLKGVTGPWTRRRRRRQATRRSRATVTRATAAPHAGHGRAVVRRGSPTNRSSSCATSPAAGARWVLNAKYKRGLSGDEAREDRFQMCGYAIAFGAARASLVYPTGETGIPRSRVLLAGDVAGKPVTIDA